MNKNRGFSPEKKRKEKEGRPTYRGKGLYSLKKIGRRRHPSREEARFSKKKKKKKAFPKVKMETPPT